MALSKFILVILIDILYSTGQESFKPFQCQSSSDQSGLVYTPNIPDFYFNVVNAADFRTDDGSNLTGSVNIPGTTYLFTVPSESATRNCSGDVVSIQYCYRARNSDIGSMTNVFNFLAVDRNELQFTITSNTSIQTIPQSSTCFGFTGGLQQICCATTPLSGLQISSSEYTFGIVITSIPVRPLAFSDSVAEYNVEQFRPLLGNGPVPGSTVTLTEEDRLTDRSLLLIRVTIEPNPVLTTEPETTTEPVLTTEPLLTTELETTTEPVSTTTEPVTTALGGIIGGCVLLFIIMTIIVCVVVLVVMVKHHKFKKTEIEQASATSYNNAIYGSEGDATYAGVGPRVHAKDLNGQQSLKCNNTFYAEGGGASYEVVLSTVWKDEDIYMVPAKDENTLYEQLGDRIGIDRKYIKLGDFLGSGQFGTVYRGVLTSDDGGKVEVAVKTLKEGSKKEDRVKFLQEAAIMGQFKHPNVVNMYGCVTNGEPILLVLELLTKGDLRDHLNHMRLDEEGGGVSVDAHTLLNYCRQVASGMAYLSNKAFVHRDLAARNILISEDEICKIADFGMSRDLVNENYYVSHGGMIPVKWTAPEALHYKKYSSASDVWSYGALMYEIWSVGHKPFENYANNKVIKLIDAGYRLPPPPGCPRAIYNIMIKCWHPTTSERPNFAVNAKQLSLPDTKLLKWSDEDKSVHPEATKLGADLLCAQELYKDLQTSYTQ